MLLLSILRLYGKNLQLRLVVVSENSRLRQVVSFLIRTHPDGVWSLHTVVNAQRPSISFVVKNLTMPIIVQETPRARGISLLPHR